MRLLLYLLLRILSSMEPTRYLFLDVDAVMVTFHVLDSEYIFLQLKTYSANCIEGSYSSNTSSIFQQLVSFNFPSFNFEQFSFSLDKYSLLAHFRCCTPLSTNVFKIPKMVQYNHRSLMILVKNAKYIPLQSKCKVIQLLPIFRTYFSELFILQVKPFINSFQYYLFCYKC